MRIGVDVLVAACGSRGGLLSTISICREADGEEQYLDMTTRRSGKEAERDPARWKEEIMIGSGEMSLTLS
jgi:hypothetical protein